MAVGDGAGHSVRLSDGVLRAPFSEIAHAQGDQPCASDMCVSSVNRLGDTGGRYPGTGPVS